MNILIIEDNPVNVFLARTIILKIIPSAQILNSETGEDGIELLASHSFDLILLDIYLPNMDGYETARTIRNLDTENKSIPIVGFSAGEPEEFKKKGYESGINDFLSKPIEVDLLKSILMKIK